MNPPHSYKHVASPLLTAVLLISMKIKFTVFLKRKYFLWSNEKYKTAVFKTIVDVHDDYIEGADEEF